MMDVIFASLGIGSSQGQRDTHALHAIILLISNIGLRVWLSSIYRMCTDIITVADTGTQFYSGENARD